MLFSPLNEVTQNSLHIAFYVINAISVFLLAKYNRNRPLFFIIIITLAYTLINYFKYNHGVIFYLTPAYLNLVFLSAVGILFFYFLPDRPFYSDDTARFLIIIFVGMALGELLSAEQIKIDFNPTTTFGCGLQIFGVSLMWAVLMTMLFFASVKNDIIGTSVAYSAICVAAGFYFSLQSSSLVLFFTIAAAIVLSGVIREVRFITRRDVATGVYNGKTFVTDAKKLPLKYGLGIICVDDYGHLLQAFRKNGIGDIMLMISKKIALLEPEALLYRCTPDEFVIIFPNAEKGTTKSRVDEIRRQIAASEFILKQIKRPLKITVSCSVADKKRSDSDVSDVFFRAHRVLQQTYKFTQNITSEALK